MLGHCVRRAPSWAFVRLLAFALTVVGVVSAGSAAAQPEVRFESGKLWVRTDGPVAVRRLLDRIAETTGVEFAVDPELGAGRIEIAVDGVELERALARIAAKIPNAGGHTMSYVSSGSSSPRLARVAVFGAGRAPGGGAPPERGAGSAEAVVVAAPTPSAADLDRQKENLVASGIPERTASEFIALTDELRRLQSTPVAAEAFIRSERYQRVMREIGRAQGKASTRE